MRRDMERAALGLAVLAAWGVYRLARRVGREFDAALFRQAVAKIPEERRRAIRDAWMTEEGIET